MLDGIISGLRSIKMAVARIPYDNIHHAVKEGDATNVQAFLEDGIDINTLNANDDTPLHVAVKESKPELVKFLLGRGADKNALNRSKMTPLHEAVRGFYTKPGFTSMQYLVEAGSDLEIKDPKGYTPLHFAFLNQNFQAMQYLVTKGADIKTSNLKGETLFHTAVGCCHFKTFTAHCQHEFMPYLKEHGADIEASNLEGDTPLFIAVKRDKDEIVESLLDLGANSDEAYEYCKAGLQIFNDANVKKADASLASFVRDTRTNLLLNSLHIESTRHAAKKPHDDMLDEPCSSSPKGKRL